MNLGMLSLKSTCSCLALYIAFHQFILFYFVSVCLMALSHFLSTEKSNLVSRVVHMLDNPKLLSLVSLYI